MIIKKILLSALLIAPFGAQSSMTTRVCMSMKKMISEASLYMKQSADIIKGFTKILILDPNKNLDLLVGYVLIISGGVHIGLFGLKKIFPNAEYDAEARMIKAKQRLDQLERKMAQEMPFEERLRLALQQDGEKNRHRLKS